jgi:P27 family predicted phage terminase small subunit
VAAAKWREVVRVLIDRGDPLDEATRDAVCCYATAWSRWTAAESEVQKLGAVIRTQQGAAAVSPYVTIAAQAQRQLRQWGAVLGLTGRARKQKADDDRPDPLLRLLKPKATG